MEEVEEIEFEQELNFYLLPTMIIDNFRAYKPMFFYRMMCITIFVFVS